MAIFTNQATLTYNGNVINSNIATGELVEVLSATKTAVLDTYGPNSRVTYVIQIRNTADTAYTGLTLTDNLGAYSFGAGTLVPLDYVDGSIRYYANGILQTAPTVTAGPPLTVTGISVPANGVATVIYVTETNRFAPLDTAETITNQATVTGAGVTAVTAEAVVRPESEADLTITKSLYPTTVAENGQLTYTFTIQNTGNAPVTAADDVVITDEFAPVLKNLAVTFDGITWTEPTNYTYDATSGLFQTVAGQVTVPAATYTQDAATGAWVVEPGVATLTVTGNV